MVLNRYDVRCSVFNDERAAYSGSAAHCSGNWFRKRISDFLKTKQDVLSTRPRTFLEPIIFFFFFLVQKKRERERETRRQKLRSSLKKK